MKHASSPKRILEVVDPSDLTDLDWMEINTLKRAYAESEESFKSALAKLAEDPIRYLTVAYALDPIGTRAFIQDGFAEAGISDDDVREMIAKLSGRDAAKH